MLFGICRCCFNALVALNNILPSIMPRSSESRFKKMASYLIGFLLTFLAQKFPSLIHTPKQAGHVC